MEYLEFEAMHENNCMYFMGEKSDGLTTEWVHRSFDTKIAFFRDLFCKFSDISVIFQIFLWIFQKSCRFIQNFLL